MSWGILSLRTILIRLVVFSQIAASNCYFTATFYKSIQLTHKFKGTVINGAASAAVVFNNDKRTPFVLVRHPELHIMHQRNSGV